MSTALPLRVRRPLLGATWALPVFGALLTVSTVTHQPSYFTDFPAYADYVTTAPFLISHLGASIVGAAIGIIGTVAAVAVLVGRTARPGRLLLGAASSVVGHVLNTAVFGVAAFAQPAIGRAYRTGLDGIVDVNSDVYGPALFGTVIVAALFWIAGAVLIGTSVARTGSTLRIPGLVVAVALPIFYVAGPTVEILQPVAGLVFTVAAVLIAKRLPAATATAVGREEISV
jgi:hypothetical protein